MRDTGTRPAFPCWVDQKFVPVNPNEIFYQPNTSAWLWLFRFLGHEDLGKLRLVQLRMGTALLSSPESSPSSTQQRQARGPMQLFHSDSTPSAQPLPPGDWSTVSGGWCPDSAPDQSGETCPVKFKFQITNGYFFGISMSRAVSKIQIDWNFCIYSIF